MKFHIYGQVGIVIRVVLVVCLSTLLAVTLGCGSGGGGGNGSDDEGDSSETQETIDNSAFTTMMSAVSEGQLTLNNRWTQSDLDDQDISDPIKWEGKGTLTPAQINSFTTLVQQYKQRLKQCEQDALAPLDSEGNRRCYPRLTIDLEGDEDDLFRCAFIPNISRFNKMRYGYYCGRDYPSFPPFGPSDDPDLDFFGGVQPEPLDAVDYCCRLHDAQAWGDSPSWGDEVGENECGILMCLDQASGTPSNIMDLLPLVEDSRQCWYDWAATASIEGLEAIAGCAGNQFNDARAPILGP